LKTDTPICIVSCSVLKKELLQLKSEGKIDAELVFVSKYFHVDYEAVEKNVRKVLETTLKRFNGKIVLVYGDLCLGQSGEMKKLAEEYGVVKVDALNCIDCQLGGGGIFLKADPEHNLMFMGSGMLEFFRGMKEKLQKEGVTEAAFAAMFNGLKGVVLLDTCGDADSMQKELEKSGIGLKVSEVRKVGLEPLTRVICEAIEKSKR
jgi:hypothetical protein